MTAKIDFTDAIGAVSLSNLKPFPGDRFANWTPISMPVGDTANRLSDGALSMFRFRDDYAASFELPYIPASRVGGVAQVDIADRLRYWLMNGGTCSVTTGDADASVYPTCGLFPGSTPEVIFSDRVNFEYTLRLTLLNLAGSPTRMVCRYADQ